MIAETGELIGERSGGDGLGFRGPMLPALPSVAAAPSGHDQKAHSVGLVEELVAVDLAFQTDGVQAHVLDIVQVCVEALRGPAQEHIRGPGGAADQYVLTVDFEKTPAIAGQFGSDFTNSKIHDGTVRFAARRDNPEVRLIKVRIAHLVGPPELGLRQLKLRKLFGSEANGFGFFGSKFHRLGKLYTGKLDLKRRLDRMAGCVGKNRTGG